MQLITQLYDGLYVCSTAIDLHHSKRANMIWKCMWGGGGGGGRGKKKKTRGRERQEASAHTGEKGVCVQGREGKGRNREEQTCTTAKELA